MTRPTMDVLVARYVEAFDEVKRLRAARRRCVCDFEFYLDPEEGPRNPLRVRAPFSHQDDKVHPRGAERAFDAPCWRTFSGEDGEIEYVGEHTEEGWCESCRERERLHSELRAATRRRTARLAALMSSSRARTGQIAGSLPRS